MNNTSALTVTWSPRVDERSHKTGRALLFGLSSATYAISVEFVRRVIELPSAVPVPAPMPVAGSINWFLGMASCDGIPLPLVNAHSLFNSELNMPLASLKRAIFIDCAHGSLLLAVDHIITLTDLSGNLEHKILPAQYPVHLMETSYESNGVTVCVLNVAKIFESVAVDNKAVESLSGEKL